MTLTAPVPGALIPPLTPQISGSQVRLGRHDAELLAVSTSEARLRHHGGLKVGSEVPVTLHIDRNRIVVTGLVRSCSVVAIGATGGTIFETHLSFAQISSDLREWLERRVSGGLV